MTGTTKRVQRGESWKDDAKCIDRWDLFFGEDSAEVGPEQEYEARKLCRSCLVQSTCWSYSEQHGERAGVWGGVNREKKRHGRRPTV